MQKRSRESSVPHTAQWSAPPKPNKPIPVWIPTLLLLAWFATVFLWLAMLVFG